MMKQKSKIKVNKLNIPDSEEQQKMPEQMLPQIGRKQKKILQTYRVSGWTSQHKFPKMEIYW